LCYLLFWFVLCALTGSGFSEVDFARGERGRLAVGRHTLTVALHVHLRARTKNTTTTTTTTTTTAENE
jgi:hypothetical protein